MSKVRALKNLIAVVLVISLSSIALFPCSASEVYSATHSLSDFQEPLPGGDYIFQYPILLSSSTLNSPSGYTQMLTVGNSHRNYTYYGINSHISNVMFALPNGTNLYAWIQSYNSTSAVIWVKIPFPTTEIEMQVFPGFDNLLSSNGYIGEFSAIHPGYDNYKKVFSWYYTNLTFNTGNPLGSGNYNVTGFIAYFKSITSIPNDVGLQMANVSGDQNGALRNQSDYAYFNIWDGGGLVDNYNFSIKINNIVWYDEFVTESNGNDIWHFELNNVSGQETYNEKSSSLWFIITAGGFINITFDYLIPLNDTLSMPTFSFAPPTIIKLYRVTFNETGLPSGTEWSVCLGNLLNTSNFPVIAFEVPNGTYRLSIENVSGLSATPSSSYVLVEGTNISVSVSFSKFYTVTFLESGLAKGTFWNITIGNVTHSSNNSKIVFTVKNGTYDYSVGRINGTSLSDSTGRVTIDGHNVTEFFRFLVTVQFTFIEAGLPPGTHWSVRINGNYYSSSSALIQVNLTNGSYPFEIILPYGYNAKPETGIVNGNNTYVFVNVSSYLGYEIGIPIFAVIITAVLMFKEKRSKSARK